MPQLVQAYSRNDLRLLLKENQISYHKKVRALINFCEVTLPACSEADCGRSMFVCTGELDEIQERDGGEPAGAGGVGQACGPGNCDQRR